ELFVSDWWQSVSIPLAATLRQVPEGLEIKVENKSSEKLTELHLAIGDRIIGLGSLGGQETKTQTVTRNEGMLLRSFVSNFGGNFQNAVVSRQRAHGPTASGQLSEKANTTVA